MTFLHGRWRRRVSLLCAGALEVDERARVEAHLAGCAECRKDAAELRATLELLARDPVRTAEPPIPPWALRARVFARLDAPAEVRASLAARRRGLGRGRGGGRGGRRAGRAVAGASAGPRALARRHRRDGTRRG